MHISSSLPLTALWLAFGSVVFAQCPASSPTPPPAVVPVAAASPSPVPSPVPSPASKLPVITQSSRVRAFNAGPGGEVRSLYLQNGSVVNLSPALGGQLGPVIRKGEKITVLGTKSQVNGQSFVEAASIRLNDQTFSSNTASVSLVLAAGPGGATPRPPAAPLPPPSFPPNKKKPVTPSPADGPADASTPQSDFGGPPPPPPDGMAPPPPPDGMAPPPPPLA